MSDIKFSIGVSRDKDSKKAGREATLKMLEGLQDKLKFVFLFSTIDYRSKKDLDSVLEGCRELLDKDVQLIGGTVTGFICKEGCFIRGVVAVGCSGDDIVVSTDYKEDIRKNPGVIGRQIAEKIKNELDKSVSKNKVVFDFMSGPLEPEILTYDIFRSITNKIPYPLLRVFRDLLLGLGVKYLNTGPGQEEDVLMGMGETLKDYSIVGCSTFDDMRCLNSRQFFNDKVLDGSIVALGLSFNNDIILEEKIKLDSTGKKFKIRKGWGDYCIDEMEGEPFMKRYLKEMGWPQEYIKKHVEQLTRVTFYYPIGFRDEDWIYAFPSGIFFGDTMLTNRKVRSDTIELFLTPPGKAIFQDYNNYIEKLNQDDISLVFIIEAMWIYGVLGSNVFTLKSIMDKKMGDKPYIIIFGAGEHFKEIEGKPRLNDYARVMLTILKKEKSAREAQ